MWLLEELEAITELGDLHSMDFAKASGEVRETSVVYQSEKKLYLAGSKITPRSEEERVGRQLGGLKPGI